MAEFQTALARLPHDQREALILIGALGFSHEEVANICGCAIGTIKSRLSRARAELRELLLGDDEEQLNAASAEDAADHQEKQRRTREKREYHTAPPAV